MAMYISKLVINNFKGYKGKHTFNFKKGVNYLSGSNNVGKSSILDAIECVFGNKKSTISDFRNTSIAPSEEVSIEITLTSESVLPDLIDNIIDNRSISTKIKDRIQHTYNTFHIRLKVTTESITSGTKNSKPGEVLIYSEKLDTFENVTGIDAPLKKLIAILRINANQSADSEIKNTLSSSYMTVLHHYSSEFFSSDKFMDLNKSVNVNLLELQKILLNTMSKKLSRLVNEQFEENIETYVKFKTFEDTNYLQNSEIRIKENDIDTNLFDNGNGMQRAVTISLIKEMASIKNLSMKPSVFLIDEPEVFLHPTGQKSLANELVKLSEEQQVFIATHSPYIIDSYTKEVDNINSMTVLRKLTNGETEIKDISDKITNITSRPTTAEISYFAYNIPTLEFHDQLFSKAQDITKTTSIQAIDQKFSEYISSEPQSDFISSLCIETNYDKNNYYTLPTKIRNLAHHDYNSESLKMIVDGDDLRNSIEFLLRFNRNLQ